MLNSIAMKSTLLNLLILLYFVSNFNVFAQDEASSEEEDIIHEATDPSAVPGPDQIPNDGSSVTNNRPTEETSHNSEELDFGEIDPNWDLDDTLKCIKCDSRLSGKRCFRVDNPQNFKKCRSTEGLCYTLLLNGDILRGCIGDSILPYIDSYEFTLNSIKLCNNNLCNKENMEDTCVVCEGDGCNDLATIQQDDMQRVCSFGKEPSGCFLRINKDNSHQRGCVVDLSETEKTMCQTSISTKCQSCFKPNCNKKLDLYQKCYFCNGTTDNNCHRLTSHHTKITCIKYGTQCLVGIDEAGFTHRGCSSNSDEHELLFPIGYTLCDGDLCNRNLFPDNRVQCYACNIGSGCDGLHSAHPEWGMHTCRHIPAQCFSYKVKEGHIIRGCLRENATIQNSCTEEIKENKPITERQCYMCNFSGCNSYEMTIQNLGLSPENFAKSTEKIIKKKKQHTRST